MSAAPIACMLSGTDYRERLSWIADLNRKSLVASERDDLRLTLTFRASALKQVRQMVDQERACCPFLTFEVVEQRKSVVVSITVPEEARETADTVFAPFMQASAETNGCGCCGGAG